MKHVDGTYLMNKLKFLYYETLFSCFHFALKVYTRSNVDVHFSKKTLKTILNVCLVGSKFAHFENSALPVTTLQCAVKSLAGFLRGKHACMFYVLMKAFYLY